MTKESAGNFNIESIVKFATIFISVAGLLWGGATFLLTKKFEARRPFLDYQLELYKTTAQIVTKIATSEDANEQLAARKKFYELYWGELVLVESPAVESRMANFNRELKNESAYLRTHAYDLVHELRASLAKSWGVQDWEFTREIAEPSK